MELFVKANFRKLEYYGVNDHANWRIGAASQVYELLTDCPSEHPLLRNTIIGAFRI